MGEGRAQEGLARKPSASRCGHGPQWWSGQKGFLGQMASRWCGGGRAPVMALTWPHAHTEPTAQKQTQQTSLSPPTPHQIAQGTQGTGCQNLGAVLVRQCHGRSWWQRTKPGATPWDGGLSLRRLCPHCSSSLACSSPPAHSWHLLSSHIPFRVPGTEKSHSAQNFSHRGVSG